MAKNTEFRSKYDVTPQDVQLTFLPVETRVPLKFGAETLTSVTCARVCMRVADETGKITEGWGETPISVQWIWPGKLSYGERFAALEEFCVLLTEAWRNFDGCGHAMEVGYSFQREVLPDLLKDFNSGRDDAGTVPLLAALVCCSPFDIALHDAYGKACGVEIYKTYNSDYMNDDLSAFISPADGADVSFGGKYPADYLVSPPDTLMAWHLVGGMDKLEESELDDGDPDDGYPVLLRDWIRRDGLKCLKIKLRGNDSAWDYDRLLRVGQISIEEGVEYLTSDFNCTVTDPVYVIDILDRMESEYPEIHAMILYVEQPFPYDLEKYPIDAHAISERKPLFLDESAHDWELVRLGHSLGWTGVALKTCKTQTGAILSACWARAHGMGLMVQDLTNPMLAQIPHVLLSANVGTIMGVETNGMQFYPEASAAEEAVHGGLYRRRNGCVDLSTLGGAGFGYRLDEIGRVLPDPLVDFTRADSE